MIRLHAFSILAFLLIAETAFAAVVQQPVVLELFTSQGCSACPPADELMGTLSADDSLLPLSYHVDYWDRIGWKDPFSSAVNTQRQYAYASALEENRVFTPQLIVNGTVSVVGSDTGDVQDAIADARHDRPLFDVTVSGNAAGGYEVKISSDTTTLADIWEIRFKKGISKTKIGRGENSGRVMENVNNVTSFKWLGAWPQKKATYSIPAGRAHEDGLAIIVQEAQKGKILGAAYYTR